MGVESGSGLTPGLSHIQPADILVLNWERGKHAALDITATSPLTPSILTAASLSEGAAAEEAEARKHGVNDPKCSELGWVCIPLAVKTYGNWGREAQTTFSHLASHLAITTSSHKGKVLIELYSRLNSGSWLGPYWPDVHPPWPAGHPLSISMYCVKTVLKNL